MHFVLLITVTVFLMAPLAPNMMAEETEKPGDRSTAGAGEDVSVYIVYAVPPTGEDPEAFHIRTLASVLGSEEAAREALVYHYKHAASGFSAKLTPRQVAELSKKPGVLQVVPSRTLQIHSGSVNSTHRLGVLET